VGFLKQSKFPIPGLFTLLLTLLSCGFYNPEVSGQGPVFRPEVDMIGNFRGRRIVYDRNDSIIETAVIDRSCELKDGPVVDCRLDILYERIQDRVVLNRSYALEYREALDASLHLTSEREDLKGKIHGAAFHLTGEGEVPGSEEKVNQEIRFVALSDGEALETILYSYLGFRSGKSVTFWRRVGE